MEPETNIDETIDPHDYVVPPGMGLLVIEMPYSSGPKHAGDRKQMWNPENPDEVADARRSFTDMKAKGYLAYRVGPEGEKAEQIHEFNAAAGKVIMTAPMKGG